MNLILGRSKGKRSRGTFGKILVFWLLKRDGKVYTVQVINPQKSNLIPIIKEYIKPYSIFYTDIYRSYDVLNVSEFTYYRINYSKLFADKHIHINRIKKIT